MCCPERPGFAYGGDEDYSAPVRFLFQVASRLFGIFERQNSVCLLLVIFVVFEEEFQAKLRIWLYAFYSGQAFPVCECCYNKILSFFRGVDIILLYVKCYFAYVSRLALNPADQLVARIGGSSGAVGDRPHLWLLRTFLLSVSRDPRAVSPASEIFCSLLCFQCFSYYLCFGLLLFS